MICNDNNNIPIKILSQPYVLVIEVLCNCRIETEDNFLLESMPTCYGKQSDLVMYFTIKTAFMTDALDFHILQDWTTHEQTLPISLQTFNFNSKLLETPKALKDFVYQYKQKKDILDRHEDQNNEISKHSFFDNYIMDIFSIYSSNIIYDSYGNNCVYHVQAYKNESLGNSHCFSANKGNRCNIW